MALKLHNLENSRALKASNLGITIYGQKITKSGELCGPRTLRLGEL